MSHTKNLVLDRDPHFRVDPNTRKIEYMSSDSLVLIQGDHNSERVTFAVPRYVEGHDMSECNTIQVHYINMSSANKATKSSGIYEVDDVQIDPNDDYTVLFTWLLSQGTTLHVGSLNFVLRFACTEGSSVLYSWNTSVYSQINILETIDNINNMPTVYTDVLENWYAELMMAGELGKNVVNQTKDKALAEIAVEKEQCLEEIAKAETDAIEHIGAVEVIREIEQDILDNIDAAEKKTTNEINKVAIKATTDVASKVESAAETINEVNRATKDLNAAKDKYIEDVTIAMTEATEAADKLKADFATDIDEMEIKVAEDLDLFRTEAGNIIAGAKTEAIESVEAAAEETINVLQTSEVKSARYLKDQTLIPNNGADCDLNDIKEAGVYVLNNQSELTSWSQIIHRPEFGGKYDPPCAFRLEVLNGVGLPNGDLCQAVQTLELIGSNPRVFKRVCVETMWYEWTEYISSDNIAEQKVNHAVKADKADVATEANHLAETDLGSFFDAQETVTNLDLLTIPGVYTYNPYESSNKVEQSSIPSSLDNESSVFRVFVSETLKVSGYSQITQTLETILDSNARLFKRRYNDGSWEDWVEYISSANIASKIENATVAKAVEADRMVRKNKFTVNIEFDDGLFELYNGTKAKCSYRIYYTSHGESEEFGETLTTPKEIKVDLTDIDLLSEIKIRICWGLDNDVVGGASTFLSSTTGLFKCIRWIGDGWEVVKDPEIEDYVGHISARKYMIACITPIIDVEDDVTIRVSDSIAG